MFLLHSNIVSRFGQKWLLDALNINVNVNIKGLIGNQNTFYQEMACYMTYSLDSERNPVLSLLEYCATLYLHERLFTQLTSLCC